MPILVFSEGFGNKILGGRQQLNSTSLKGEPFLEGEIIIKMEIPLFSNRSGREKKMGFSMKALQQPCPALHWPLVENRSYVLCWQNFIYRTDKYTTAHTKLEYIPGEGMQGMWWKRMTIPYQVCSLSFAVIQERDWVKYCFFPTRSHSSELLSCLKQKK